MDKLGGDVNWSALAAEAFSAEIQRIKARKAALKGKPMNAAIERLRKSKQAFAEQAIERGRGDGTQWAMQTAEYGELKALAEAWPEFETTDTTDAHGAPGAFLAMIGQDMDRAAINDFWTNLGKEHRDDDAYSTEYWDGFAEGALEVFGKMDESA